MYMRIPCIGFVVGADQDELAEPAHRRHSRLLSGKRFRAVQFCDDPAINVVLTRSTDSCVSWFCDHHRKKLIICPGP